MTSRWRWILALAATTGIDLAVRFAASFDFTRVMRAEAVIFPATAIVLAWLRRIEPVRQGWPNRLRLGLIWLFGLGAIRPILWTLGAPLMVANLATAGVALVALLAWTIRRRRNASIPPKPAAAP